MSENDELKLIYVLKVGVNTKGENMYEFIFSKDIDNINESEWGWDKFPAKGNSEAPEIEYIDEIYEFKTDLFLLKCLHELQDRTYLDGYYKIHSIAFEDLDFKNQYGIEYDDVIVFHYGMPLNDVISKFYKREIIVDHKSKQFKATRNITLQKNTKTTEKIDTLF